MKRLAAVTMMIAVVAFTAAIVSAQDSGWGAIHGTYAMMATGDCLHSDQPFINLNAGDSTKPVVWKPTPDSLVWDSSFMGDGIWAFNSDGTGSAYIRQYCMTSPAGDPTNSNLVTGTLTVNQPIFQYRFEPDGTLTVAIPNFTVHYLVLSGSISTDHKTMTLTSGHQPQRVPLVGEPHSYQLCTIGRVLTRVNE
jgi:hypothetical protein